MSIDTSPETTLKSIVAIFDGRADRTEDDIEAVVDLLCHAGYVVRSWHEAATATCQHCRCSLMKNVWGEWVDRNQRDECAYATDGVHEPGAFDAEAE